MDLHFDAAERLGLSKASGACAGKVPSAALDEFTDAIRKLSEQSATVRELNTQYEDNSLPDIRSTDDAVYLLVEGSDVLGFLRLGVRTIKVSAPNSEAEDKQVGQANSSGYAAFSSNLKSMSPRCLFDFFVVGGFERRGLGRLLFETMLSGEYGIVPASIAYSHPSDAMYAFLLKHFGLSGGRTVSTFTIFDGFYDSSSTLQKPITQTVDRRPAKRKRLKWTSL